MQRTILKRLEPIKKRLLQHGWIQLAVGTLRCMGDDNASDMAGGLSYYAMMSVFPLLLGVVAVLGFIFPSEEVQQALLGFFQLNLPTLVDILKNNISSIIELRGPLGILGLAGLFWSGSALFGSIERVANRAWGVQKRRHFLITKLRDVALGIATGLIFFISLGLAALLSIMPDANLPFGITLTSVITHIVTFALVFVVFLLTYKYMPDTSVAWHDVWMPALLGSVVLAVVRVVFAWYLDRFANYQLIYGSIASVIAFLVGMYLSAFVLVAGIELSAVYARMKKEGKFGRASA